MIWLIILILLILLLKIKEMHLHIDWKSFLRKGFKKLDNKFGIFCYTGKQGTGKTYSAIRFTLQEQAKEKYLVLTNIKSFHNSCANSKYYTNIQEIIEFCEKEFKKPEERRQKVLIFFDEIFTCLEKGDDKYINSNGYISLKFFEELGFNSLSKIKDNIRVSHYITKYISKDAQKTSSGYTYFHSKDLKKSTKTTLDFKEYMNDLELIYENEYIKKYVLKVDEFG